MATSVYWKSTFVKSCVFNQSPDAPWFFINKMLQSPTFLKNFMTYKRKILAMSMKSSRFLFYHLRFLRHVAHFQEFTVFSAEKFSSCRWTETYKKLIKTHDLSPFSSPLNGGYFQNLPFPGSCLMFHPAQRWIFPKRTISKNIQTEVLT